jgi:hypothetical protein
MTVRFDDCRCSRDSGKALLVDIPDLDEEVWIPQSQIHDDSEVYDAEDNAEGTLVVKRWFAEKKGWV